MHLLQLFKNISHYAGIMLNAFSDLLCLAGPYPKLEHLFKLRVSGDNILLLLIAFWYKSQ